MVKVEQITNNITDSVLIYSININARTFPDVRDGLKPVGKRILYTFKKKNLLSNSPMKKGGTSAGYVMEYHPHGDSSIYDAIMKMAQDFYNNIPIIEVQGSFGNICGDKPAAGRYTEVRLSKYGDLFVKDIDKNSVSWKPSYDYTAEEPKFLPVPIPNLLVNG